MRLPQPWASSTTATLAIEDLPEGVRFLVRPHRKPLVTLWNYIYPTFGVYLLSDLLPGDRPVLRAVLVAVFGGCFGAWLSWPRTITVTFDRDGVRVKGAFASGYPAPRWIPLGDISSLFWQPESNRGPDAPFEPSGLYARRGLTNVCLLPFLSPADTTAAIRAIEQKYSWVDRTPGSSDSLLFSDTLVRLDLQR